MKLITFSYQGTQSFGTVKDQGITNLGIELGKQGLHSIRDVLAADALELCEEMHGRALPQYTLDEIKVDRAGHQRQARQSQEQSQLTLHAN